MAIRKELTNKNGFKIEVPIITKEELLFRINKLEAESIDTLIQRKAFVSFLFLTACRVSEVCKYIKYDSNGNGYLVGEPLRKSNISFDNNGFMDIVDVRTLKRRIPISKRIAIETKNDLELFELFKIYYDKLGHNDFLFSFTRQHAYKILSKIGLYNHYLRHLRLTQLVTKYHFDSIFLQKFVNWESPLPAKYYVHLDTQDIKNKFTQEREK